MKSNTCALPSMPPATMCSLLTSHLHSRRAPAAPASAHARAACKYPKCNAFRQRTRVARGAPSAYKAWRWRVAVHDGRDSRGPRPRAAPFRLRAQRGRGRPARYRPSYS